MRPPFCRIGSKSDMAKTIVPLIPPHKIYVEPFIGGGAIYWNKKPANKSVINDLDKSLIRDYKLLKRVKSRDFRKDLNTLTKLRKFHAEKHTSDADKLTNAIVTRCNTFGSKGVGNYGD